MKAKTIVCALCGMSVVVASCQKPRQPEPAQKASANQTNPDKAVASPAASAKPSERELAMSPGSPTDIGAQQYAGRLESLRRLMQLAASEGHPEEAIELLTSLLDEIEAWEGREVSRQVAFSEACNFERQRRHAAARDAFNLFATRFAGDSAVAEAIVRRGACLIELNEHGPAEAALRDVIADYPDARAAEQAWRKLALAQLLAGRYDGALKTLDQMDRRYIGTHLSEYAKMRKGYVLVAANRIDEGRSQYERFIKECRGSAYCRYARRQLIALDPAAPATSR